MKSKQAPAGHAAGIYSDMTLDGPEIGTLVAVVDRAKNLPNRKTIGKQDPYCAMRLAKDAKKTGTDKRGGQTPKWDQELRFTVHDSPDYYKLKVSVFNDDKKTDLIGEAWIDLTNVVKLGGGQADIWQQLTFKGKYAGEVRTELTFYDTREQPQEKRRTKEKSQTASDESRSDFSMQSQRSLGPREIQRRPLPVSPATAASPHVSALPEPTEIPPLRPPKEPLHDQSRVHAPTPRRLRPTSAKPLSHQPFDQYHTQPPLPQEQYSHANAEIHTFQEDDHHHKTSFSHEQNQQSWQHSHEQHHRDYPPEAPDDAFYDQFGCEQNNYDPYSQHPQSVYPNEMEIWQQQRPHPTHMQSEPVTPQYSTALVRPAPTSINSDGQLQRYRPHPRFGAEASSLHAAVYYDTPSQQSWRSYDAPQSPLEGQGIGPPLPPKHRDTPPQRPRDEYPPSAYVPQPLQINQKRVSISERSPLQSLEDDYDRRQDPWQQQRTPQRHSMYDAPLHTHENSSEQQLQLYDRRQRYEAQTHSQDPRMQFPTLLEQRRRNSHDVRQPSFGQYMTEEPEMARSDDIESSSYIAARQPTVQDAPPSPGLSPMLQPAMARKAVGDQPKRLSAAPFGPDSYDVLNPAQSPVTNDGTPFQTPEQAKEAARLRVVERLRNLGPIIGNDGREIDPSDHLPSDTWAPEPEWKNKKPEHVIHIRSKKSPNKPAGARASPVVIRHNPSASTQSTPASTSPLALRTPNSAGTPHKLQKPVSARPLPNQPYSSPLTSTQARTAAASSPALVSPSNHVHFDDSPYYQRKPSHNPRLSFEHRPIDQQNRPALSEYQVPIGSGRHSREPSHGHTFPQAVDNHSYNTPTKYNSRRTYPSPHEQSPYDTQYQYENNFSPAHSTPRSQQKSHQYYDDPLAAEMSLIDIGPSRSDYNQGNPGRSMVRARGAR